MKTLLIIILIIGILIGLSFVDMFPKQVKSGKIHIDFWTWLQVKRGKIFID